MQNFHEGDEVKVILTDDYELNGTIEKLYEDGAILLDENTAFGDQIYINANEIDEIICLRRF